MQLLLNPRKIEDYRTFLAVKQLPSYRFEGRTAIVPDEYAERIGATLDDSSCVSGAASSGGLAAGSGVIWSSGGSSISNRGESSAGVPLPGSGSGGCGTTGTGPGGTAGQYGGGGGGAKGSGNTGGAGKQGIVVIKIGRAHV